MGCSPWDLPALSAFRHSNLQCFLHSTTPFLPLPPHPHPQEFPTSDGCWEGVEKKEASTGRLFWLRDVWRCYEEWSAYGAAVPILLPSLDTTVQYYSPSLSALQIYTTTPFPFPVPSLRLRMGSKIDGCEIEENGSSDLAVWVESSQLPPRQPHVCGRGYLYCQYNEISSPYDRVPITQKINELAKDFPGLMELPSSHLSPYSWMAVAWYPLYQIPVVTNEQELSACFLTYHLFAFSSQGLKSIISDPHMKMEEGTYSSSKSCGEESGNFRFAPFGVATYKLCRRLWINPQMSDQKTLISYQKAAVSWLEQVQFQHHDFNFMFRKPQQFGNTSVMH